VNELHLEVTPRRVFDDPVFLEVHVAPSEDVRIMILSIKKW